tara:strand:+ start:364 stop:615 length:252 start_codon:yes stop_codon:yes gene_type:complete
MINFFRNKVLEKILYWLSAIAILVAVPLITIFILKLGTLYNPLGLLIKFGIYIFCGGFTFVGFIAMILFFYENILKKFKKKIK